MPSFKEILRTSIIVIVVLLGITFSIRGKKKGLNGERFGEMVDTY